MASGKNSSGNRLDVGWQHGIDIDKNLRKVKCKNCQKIINGGIFRFKHHLACNYVFFLFEPCILRCLNYIWKKKFLVILRFYNLSLYCIFRVLSKMCFGQPCSQLLVI